MKYIALKHDVYLVEGVQKHCIYDLQKGDLHHINTPTLSLLKDWLEQGVEEELEEPEAAALQAILSNEIVEYVDETQPLPDIRDLQQPYNFDFSWIEVTQTCNLACTHCYEGSSPKLTRRISYEDFTQVADELKAVGVKRIQFIGGEPTVLKEDLKRMIRYARDKFDSIEVYTNGMLINDDWAQFFKEWDVKIALSIHSYIPEEHDKVTLGKGSHEKVLRAVDYLIKYGITYRTAAVKLRNHEIGDRDQEPFELSVDLPRLTGRANISMYDLEMFKLKAISKDTKSFKLNKRQIVKQLSGHQCFIDHLYVDSALNVYPCVMERRFKHGNLKESKLEFMIDDRIRKMNKESVKGCQDCEFRYQCFDCRPDANGSGELSKPWYCAYDPYEGEWQDLEEMYNELKNGLTPKHFKKFEAAT